MASESKVVSVSIPARMVSELDRICDVEQMNRSELYRDALRLFMKTRRWQALREYTVGKSAAADTTQVNLERIIEEVTD
jgi:metal-responsive CopG/Arc/MetJ family transcriptional regulator